MTDNLGAVVGARIKALRAERGNSLSALARAAGIGKGSLSEIESGTRNPTLATLYALAGQLDVPLATLLDDRVGTATSADGLTATLLAVEHRADGSTVEVYTLRLEPAAARLSPAHGRPGGLTLVLEHLLVTDGRLMAGPEGTERELGPGESLDWLSDAPHTYRALDDAGAAAVLVIRTLRR